MSGCESAPNLDAQDIHKHKFALVSVLPISYRFVSKSHYHVGLIRIEQVFGWKAGLMPAT
jgi:hypothetical protein